MKKAYQVPIKQSVGTKLFRTVFPLYLLIAIVVTLIHMLIEFNNTKQHIAQELITVSNAISPGLKTALWNVNHEQVDSIVKGTERLPIITGIRIENERGEIINRSGIAKTSQTPVSDKDDGILDLLSDSFRYSSSLFYRKSGRDILVGKLTLYSSLEVVFQRVKLGFFLIVFNSLIKSLALLILFILFARVIISKPLRELTMLINDTRLDNLRPTQNPVMKTTENNELVVLKKAFNSMLGKLSEAHAQLKLHSGELEKKVAERTEELANREEKLQTAYDQLQESRDKELKALEDKRQFIADVSHELRTPISVIKLQLEAIQQGVSNDKKSQDVLQRKIHQMERLVDDLYTLSKADINQLSLKHEHFEISLLFEELLESYQPLAKQKHIGLKLQKADGCNLFVNADWERLLQAFSNLLENSLNYTNSGGDIHIYIETLEQQVEVVIEDSAPGVSDNDLPLLLKRLFRVDASRNRNTGGSGLGLAICESIIHAHGGRIGLHHSKFGGLKVIVVLPTASIEKKSA